MFIEDELDFYPIQVSLTFEPAYLIAAGTTVQIHITTFIEEQS